MFRKTPSPWIAALALVAAIPVALAAQQNVRLATLAPENSPWTKALRAMGAEWQKATSNRVRLTVYAGTIPSESEAIDRMAVDGLQGATLMVAGLATIDPAFNVFGIPFFFESDAELAYVQDKLRPMLAARLEARKYQLVNFGNGGWVRLFSKQPIRTVKELQAAKLYTTAGDPETERWFRSNGFNVVPLATAEIPKQFKLPTGAINAAPSPPVYALALQFFRDAPHMLDLRVGPLTGATVMTASAWARVSAEDRARVLGAAARMEQDVNRSASGLDDNAVAEMKKAGLNVVTLDAKAEAEFRATAAKLTSAQRGTLVPADVFDAAVRERDAYRKTRK